MSMAIDSYSSSEPVNLHDDDNNAGDDTITKDAEEALHANNNDAGDDTITNGAEEALSPRQVACKKYYNR